MTSLLHPFAPLFAVACCWLSAGFAADPKIKLFDMEAIRDPGTLEIKVLRDWHLVEGAVPTRQKFVTINVGEIWPGQDYRVPVRLVVPADRKAKGFHLTGGNNPEQLSRDRPVWAIEQVLLRGGVGLVYTVVQDPGRMGLGTLGRVSEVRFAKSLDPHDKVQYWAWPATLMRAVTLAHAETDHFKPGKVAMSGGSKNGASPSMAILHDDRMTAVHATVSPIWDSPLRLCDRAAWKELQEQPGNKGGFAGGHFGPAFNQAALDAGHTWEDLEKFAENVSGGVFISRNLDALHRRGVEMLFHPGTHDFVAYDLAWGGAHHPEIPVYLGANTGHGKKNGHPQIERDNRNRDAFLLRHFFPEKVDRLLAAPVVKHKIEVGRLKVEVRFELDSGEQSGRIWWIYDRAPDGSPGYLSKLIPDENSAEMIHDSERGVWTAEIKLDPTASRIDFFSNHRKTLHYDGRPYATYLSSPYTRVSW